MIDLGNVGGLVKSQNEPVRADGTTVKTEVIWAHQVDFANNPNLVVLKIYDFVNTKWIRLYKDAIDNLHGSVGDFLTDPPGSPDNGDSYIVDTPATGAWAGREKTIATYTGTAWEFEEPSKYGFVFNANTKSFFFFNDLFPTGAWENVVGAGSTLFNGNRAVKSQPVPGVNYGGTTISEWIENAFFPFIQAVISLNAFGLQEVGSNYTPTISGVLTPNDETTINARRVIDVTGSNTIDTPSSNIINTLAPQLSITEGIVNQYRIEADVDNNGSPITIVSPTRSVEGVLPILHGMSANNLSATTLYTSLTRLIQNQGTKDISLNGSNQFIYYAYPSTYPDLSDIFDGSGFTIFANFNRTLVNVESAGLPADWIREYKVYKTNNVTSVTGLTFKFVM